MSVEDAAAGWLALTAARERLLAAIDVRLAADPESAELHFGRGCVLDELGRPDDAKNAYLSALRCDPANSGAMNNLGVLLERFGMRREAEVLFTEAVRANPQDANAFVNLGNALSARGELRGAIEVYEAALRLVADHAEAHHGLADALAGSGNVERARAHWDIAFAGRPLRVRPYFGSAEPVRVLGIFSVLDGNVHVNDIVDDRRFLLLKYVAEYDDPDVALPKYDVAFNAIGDADLCAEALVRAKAIADRSAARVVNDPDAVAATTREGNAARLRAIPGLVAPRVVRVRRERAAESGLPFPFLLRAPGYHNGRFLERIDDASGISEALSRLPGDELLAIEYLDARKADGRVRKYRVMLVGGRLFPLHAAVGAGWNLRFAESDAARDAAARYEDRVFLENMPAVLGERAMAALEGVRDVLALDYAGIDFGLDAHGRVLLFEANATMRVPRPDSETWAYRREPVRRIYDAFADTLNVR